MGYRYARFTPSFQPLRSTNVFAFYQAQMANQQSSLNNEIIEEGYRFVQGNVIIFLHRYLDVRTNLKETANGPEPDFSSALPAYESLVPFDSENKWMVTARVDVSNGNDQEHVQKGIDELLSIKDVFEGYFDFPLLERRMLDTRVRL
jgi:mediator of RNA polymerase II transcription subunit 18